MPGTKRSTIAVIAAFGLVAVFGAPAAADARTLPTPDGLIGPLGLDVAGSQLWVGEAFAGQLTNVDKHGNRTVLVSYPGEEIAGVDVRHGDVVFTHTAYDEDGMPTVATLERVDNGTVTVVADVLAHEVADNPDGSTLYGFRELPGECAEQLPAELAEPYFGIVESHPYAVARAVRLVEGHAAPEPLFLIADAAGNAIISVDRAGTVDTLAVLPPQPLVLTEEMAASAELPPCVAGETYWFEPVPTDVEVRGGHAYVTTLPGGPEDPSFGPRGKVYRIDVSTGSVTEIADGLLTAVDLAVSPDGTVYVAELFAGRVSEVTDTGLETVVEVPLPGALEWSRAGLSIAIDVFGNGRIVHVTP